MVTMGKHTAFLVVLLAYTLSGVRAQTGVGRPCNNSKSASISFSLTSRKNETGHWISEVKMGPEVTDGEHNGGWQIHVDKNTVDNKGVPIIQVIASLKAPVPLAGPGYELFPGLGYYKLHTEGKKWEKAKRVCAQEHAHLAIINSAIEAQVLRDLLSRFPQLGGTTVAVFIGFHDKDVEGQYVTIFDQPLASTGYTSWSTISSQPDAAEDCGCVHRDGGLCDLDCNKPSPFICEQEIQPPSNAKDHVVVTSAPPTTTSTTTNPLYPEIDVRIIDEEAAE